VRALKVLGAIAANRVGAVPRPSYCTYLVTYRCNARCGMCDSWRVKPGRELTPEQVRTVFAKIGSLDVIRITGGEPFLRTDLVAVAEAVVDGAHPIVLHVTTNGSFPDRVAEFAARMAGKTTLEVMVSLDGLAEEHDRNRGKDVTFDRAVETVRTLVGAGVRTSVNHTVISERSLTDHEALVARLGELGVDVAAVLAYADSAMYGIKLRGTRAEHLIVPRGYPLHPALAGANVLGFVDAELARVEQIRSLPRRIGKRYYLRGLRARLAGEPDPRPRPRCVALRSHLRLLPDGRVPVCQFNTETVGDLVAQSFEEVWRGTAAGKSRGWVDRCPGCWAECEVIPSAIYTGDIARSIV
jgi:MoaA/NifB/PqqE/SkfB family radical SAM enzyme